VKRCPDLKQAKVHLLNQVPSIAVGCANSGRGGQGWPPRKRWGMAAAQKVGKNKKLLARQGAASH
jgi:hypothetical protein